MRRASQASFLLLAFLSFSSFLKASPQQHTAEPSAAPPGDAFISSLPADPINLTPYLASDSASASISGLIFNGLVKYDKDLNLIGDLAERWDVGENGLKIVFYLRRNVRWQDGAPFSADDVVFTYQTIMDPATPTPYSAAFDKVESVKALDPHTVEVMYAEAFSPGLASWGMGIVPKHLLEKPGTSASFARAPLGTGPYRLKKWKTGQQIELDANPDYFEGRPGIAKVVYRIIPEAASRFLELQTENLDMSDLTPLQFQRQTDSKFFKNTFRKFRYPSFGYTFLAFNLNSPLFADVKVRRALGLALDRNILVDVALKGLGQPASGPFLPGSWAADPDIHAPTRDVAQARFLLEEAGWFDTNRDGTLEKNGKPFSFTVLLNQGNGERKMAAEIIQKQLADVGVEMKIQVLEWGTFLKEFIAPRRFEAVILGWNLTKDPDIFNLFHSSNTAPGKFNFTGFKNAEVDRLLDEGRREFDPKLRAAAYHRVHQILVDESPYLFLFVPDSLSAVHSRFEGVEVTAAGLGENFIHWFVPKEKQKYLTT